MSASAERSADLRRPSNTVAPEPERYPGAATIPRRWPCTTRCRVRAPRRRDSAARSRPCRGSSSAGRSSASRYCSSSVPLVTAAVLGGQCTLQEVPEVQRPVAPAENLPVQKAHLAVGQHIGVADVRVAVQQCHRRPGEAADEGLPDVLDELIDGQCMTSPGVSSAAAPAQRVAARTAFRPRARTARPSPESRRPQACSPSTFRADDPVRAHRWRPVRPSSDGWRPRVCTTGGQILHHDARSPRRPRRSTRCRRRGCSSGRGMFVAEESRLVKQAAGQLDQVAVIGIDALDENRCRAVALRCTSRPAGRGGWCRHRASATVTASTTAPGWRTARAAVIHPGVICVPVGGDDEFGCAHAITAGMASQPRTVDVGESSALARSTSHSGKRLRISSSAIRPSSRASAEPRQ